VGIVDNAYRKGQRIAITDLDRMLDFDIGMSSTIMVGNSSTFILDKWMVTPRGYSKKYNLEGADGGEKSAYPGKGYVQKD
jgi:precorrin-3B C17-methyltransferase